MKTSSDLRRKITFGTAILFLSIWHMTGAPQARAQVSTWAGTELEQRLETARWKFEALRMNAAFNLGNIGYSTDIFTGYLPEAVPDYQFTASAPIQILLPLEKHIVLEALEIPEYAFYLETSSERSWNNALRGQVHFSFKRLYFQAGGSQANRRQFLNEDLLGTVRQRDEDLSGLALWQVSKGTSFSLLSGLRRFRYSDAGHGGTGVAEALNRNVRYLDFITYLQQGPRFRYYFDAQFTGYDFSEPSAEFKNSTSVGIFAGVDMMPRIGEVLQAAGLRGSIRLGYVHIEMKEPQRPDHDALVGRINVSIKLLRKTEGRISFSRNFQFSGYSDLTYYLVSGLGGGLSRRLSKKATFYYDLMYSRYSYLTAGAGESSIPIDHYGRYLAHILRLDIKLARNLTIGLSGTIARRMRIESGLAKDVNSLGLSLLYGVENNINVLPIGRVSN